MNDEYRSATGRALVTVIAVIAHTKKTMGGGLDELRRTLEAHGVVEPLWHEVERSRDASRAALEALAQQAELIFVWGGDGTVQRCVDAVAGEPVTIAILPAGTANLLATNLGIPSNLGQAIDVGLHGARRVLDVGVLDGQRFAVMAGVGLDAVMMQKTSSRLKNRLGHFAYIWTGAKASRMPPINAKVTVDGNVWFKGEAVCVLLGQMGVLGGGLVAFPDAQPDDGLLEVGVITSGGIVALARLLARLLHGHPERSRFTEMTRGRDVDIKLDRLVPYEVDGTARKPRHRLRASIEPGAITVCVPRSKLPDVAPAKDDG